MWINLFRKSSDRVHSPGRGADRTVTDSSPSLERERAARIAEPTNMYTSGFAPGGLGTWSSSAAVYAKPCGAPAAGVSVQGFLSSWTLPHTLRRWAVGHSGAD